MNTETFRGELVATTGSLEPLGATVHQTGVNFAVHSGADRVSLLIFANAGDIEPTQVVAMNKTDHVFHVFVEGLKASAFYLFTAYGAWDPTNGDRYNAGSQLIDPMARMVVGTKDWVAPVAFDNSNPDDATRHLRIGKVEKSVTPKCVVLDSDFDWQGDKAPNTPLVETVVYEVSVAGMTGRSNSPTKLRGTFKGMIDAIPHLKRLGVTAVELLPMMTWYRKTPFINPVTGELLENAWGYNTIAFGSPDEGLATIRGAESVEFKMLIRALHKAGIEVILDIVPNHTAESHEHGPSISLRGLDNKTYFLLVPGQLDKYINYSGCGNTLNCNDPVVRKFILDILRRWVIEYHVDGFRFDLAADPRRQLRPHGFG